MISAVAALALVGVVLAAPALIERSTTVSLLSADTISSYQNYTRFASAAYCRAAATWDCAECKHLSGVQIYASGGTQNKVPMWYVVWWAKEQTVVVGHQGTNPSHLGSILDDIDFRKDPLSGTGLFPGVSSSVEVHAGFLNSHVASAPTILTAVKRALSDHSGAKVMTVGHSLGGALATLDALYFKLNLPPNVAVKAVTYGLPRVGNKDFADLIDSMITDFTHITNKKDLVPTVPGRFAGYVHPSKEIHIVSDSRWYACEGQDNTSKVCSTGAVPTIFSGKTGDHKGPYDGIYLGNDFC